MPISVPQSILIIVVTAIFTFATRYLPFAVFGGKRKVSTTITYLGNILPPAVIAILVIYCLRETDFTSLSSILPQVLAIAVTTILHLWRKNNLLSIGGGTVCYMALVQLVFNK